MINEERCNTILTQEQRQKGKQEQLKSFFHRHVFSLIASPLLLLLLNSETLKNILLVSNGIASFFHKI